MADRRRPEGCRPSADAEEIAACIRDVFKSVGEFFDPDPHAERNLLIIFRNPPDCLVSCLERLGIEALETTDEKGSTRYVVIYDERSIELFLKIVKPPIPDVEPLYRKVRSYYDS